MAHTFFTAAALLPASANEILFAHGPHIFLSHLTKEQLTNHTSCILIGRHCWSFASIMFHEPPLSKAKQKDHERSKFWLTNCSLLDSLWKSLAGIVQHKAMLFHTWLQSPAQAGAFLTDKNLLCGSRCSVWGGTTK